MKRLRNPAYPSLEPTVPRQGANQQIPRFGQRGFSGSPGTTGSELVLRWIRVDGGQTLNASPAVTGIKGATIPATVPAALDPGEVDSAGVETEAPTGTFPNGIGYGTLYGTDGTVIGRRLVRLQGTTVLSGWTFYAGGSVSIDDDATPAGSKTFLVVNNA